VCVAARGDCPITLAKSSTAFKRFCGNAAIFLVRKINDLIDVSASWKAAIRPHVLPLLHCVSIRPTGMARIDDVFGMMPLMRKKKRAGDPMLPGSNAANRNGNRFHCYA
jgi:hypothetical protein